jgi:NADPH:quinone reductase-like Zn-dependent oxidoreductase
MTDLPKTMHGVWLIGHGDMDMLDIRQDIPVPVAGTRDVLVRVASAVINNTDINADGVVFKKRGCL